MVETLDNGGFFRHTFYDLGDGTCIAFFDVHNVGEKEGWSTAISKGNGLPVWVNHVAFKADEARQHEVRARMDAEGIEPLPPFKLGMLREACRSRRTMRSSSRRS